MSGLQITEKEAMAWLASMKKRGKRNKPNKQSKSRQFKARFVMLPARWIEALRGSSGSTYDLANAILLEAFRCEQDWRGRGVVLSSCITRMNRNTKTKATAKLVKLGLIKVKRDGNHAITVTYIKK